MNAFLCFRCSQISISVEGLRCFRCDNDESGRTEVTEDFQPPLPEPGNVSPGYYVPAADASTQTVEEDFMLLEPTREASTQTTDDDFNFLAQTVGCHGLENGTKNDCPFEEKNLHNFDQDSNANQKLIPANPSLSEDGFHNLPDNDICNFVTIGPLLEAMDDPHAVLQQRTYLCEQSSIKEHENKPNFDSILRRQGNGESIEQVNEDSKIDFAGSILFISENSKLNYSGDAFDNVNMIRDTQEEVNKPPVLPYLCRSSSCIGKQFPEILRTANAVAEQEAHTSRDVSRKDFSARCGKCGRRFFSKSVFNAHVENNCDPIPFKCDICGFKCRQEFHFIEHQRVHTGEKPHKCDQCDYATSYKRNIYTHLKSHTKK